MRHFVLNALGAGITAVGISAVVALFFSSPITLWEGAAVFGTVVTLALRLPG